MPKAYEIKNHYNIVLRDYQKVCIPNTIRTDDVGRPGHTMRLACKGKASKKWTTISWHVSKEDVSMVRHGEHYTLVAKDVRTKQLLSKIRQQYGAIRVVMAA
jgi:hypothetical protein